MELKCTILWNGIFLLLIVVSNGPCVASCSIHVYCMSLRVHCTGLLLAKNMFYFAVSFGWSQTPGICFFLTSEVTTTHRHIIPTNQWFSSGLTYVSYLRGFVVLVYKESAMANGRMVEKEPRKNTCMGWSHLRSISKANAYWAYYRVRSPFISLVQNFRVFIIIFI